MPQIELEIRDITTGERRIACLQSEADAMTWLSERPSMVEVLRVVNVHTLPDGLEARLRGCMRPMSPDEVAAKDARYREEMGQIHRDTEAMNRQAWADATGHAEHGPASGTMKLVWSENDGLHHADADDDRPIPAIVREAVDAWIAERNGWLHPRRQHVGGAMLEVWPAEVPEGQTRIEPGGQFQALPGWADEG